MWRSACLLGLRPCRRAFPSLLMQSSRRWGRLPGSKECWHWCQHGLEATACVRRGRPICTINFERGILAHCGSAALMQLRRCGLERAVRLLRRSGAGIGRIAIGQIRVELGERDRAGGNNECCSKCDLGYRKHIMSPLVLGEVQYQATCGRNIPHNDKFERDAGHAEKYYSEIRQKLDGASRQYRRSIDVAELSASSATRLSARRSRRQSSRLIFCSTITYAWMSAL